MNLLSLTNFVLLQWFGVRLTREFCSTCGAGRGYGCFSACSGLPADHPYWHGGKRPLSLLRWIVPLTGWWSSYRFISPIGLLNFILLQWLCVRVQVSFSRVCPPGVQHRWWDREIAADDRVSFSLLRWIVPLTGWWSPYRWIGARR